MGQHLAEALRKVFLDTGRQLKELSVATGLRVSQLSEYQNNRRTPSFTVLDQIADGYGLPYRDVVRLWLEDQAGTQAAIDRLSAEVLPSRSASPTTPFSSLVGALSGSRDVHRAAGKVVSHFEKSKQLLDASTHDILTALTRIPALQVVEGKSATSISAFGVQWTPLAPGSKISKARLFVAKRPAPVLAEFHSFPGGIGGLHRQPDLPSRPACYELWSVAVGEGLVLVQREKEQEGWDEFDAAPGTCGYYWSANRHIWLNTNDESPLVVFHIFYPYRRSDLSPGGSDEAIEFQVRSPGSAVTADVLVAIRNAIRKRPRMRPAGK